MNLNLFAEDKTKQESGSVYYLEDGHFCVKRVGTSEYYQQVELIKKNIYGFAPKDIDNNLLIAHWLAEFGVTSWDGILADGEELKYSKANALKVFLNPAYFMSLNMLLVNHGSDYSNYLSDEISEDIESVKKK